MKHKPKVLIIGCEGTLGSEFVRYFAAHPDEFDVVAVNRQALDITDEFQVKHMITIDPPDVVINCAAYNDVDGAQKSDLQAMLVNYTAVKNLAAACKESGCIFMHFSTNYVFDGVIQRGYLESATQCPINKYGLSKMLGEVAISMINPNMFIIRTSWLYGKPGTGNSSKKNFPEQALEKASSGNDLEFLADQYGQPTWTKDLVEACICLLKDGVYDFGIYHLVNSGTASRVDWAREVLAHKKLTNKIVPISSKQSGSVVPRPKHGILLNTKAPGLMRHWREALAAYFAEQDA